MEPLQEVELIDLAKDIVPENYTRLCNALGYSYATGQQILLKRHNNFNEALVEILITWKTDQRETDQLRFILASKLREVGLGDLGDSLCKGSYHLTRRDQRDRHDPETVPSPNWSAEMATGRGITDELLANLAEDIERGEQVEALGRALGFKSAAINRYSETNNKGDRVTYKGTRDMLLDWRQTVEPDNQHLRLKEALINAKLVMLADTYLKDTPGSYHLNRRDQRDRHDRETIPAQMLSAGVYQPEPNPRDSRNQTTFECDSDIYNMKISDSLTVGQCREKLKKRYLNSLCQVQMAPWDPNDFAELNDIHTVVTMMKKDSHGKDSRERQVLQGSVSEVFSTKVHVNGRQPLRILVSAPAGRGKTTAVAKMAYDWAKRVQGSSLENLPLLFAVKLRKAGKQTSIAEAIRSQLLSDVDDLTEDGLHSFIRRNQNICHIILDGLDEYAGIARNQGLGSNIVGVMLWEEYPECRVLITTRPHLENFFNQGELPRVYTKMWIEGFSHDSSREYIDKFFSRISNSSHGHRLRVYLDSQPLIKEIVVTPLFCLMVCHLWNEGSLESDTTTQTELLDRVNQFLLHHANARSKAEERMTDEELDRIICKLGEVALAGLLDDTKKLVFTPHDFRKVPAVLDKACQLGIVSKKTDLSTFLPQVQETTSTTIEFYHKLAQEHSAGKYLAAKTKKYMLRLKLSKLDSVLRKIRTDIGDYENLIRFAAGTENSLCIRIMEALLANSSLDESERYRILLDCSSETKGREGNVSSLVQRCVNAQRIVLKSPTVYTVVGMQNLPEQLKGQIREVKFEDSTPSTDVVSGLWYCLGDFSALRNLTISDCSLGFPSSSPKLPLVMKLKVDRVTSQSYDGLLSSIPNVKEIDIAVDNAEEEDISQIQTSLRRHLTGQELTLIRLGEPLLQESVSGTSSEIMRGLGLLASDSAFREATLSRVVCGPGETVDLVQGSARVMTSSLYSKQVSESLNCNRETINNCSLTMRYCKLSATVTSNMWSCLRSFPSLRSLTISDSSLSFPSSPPELTSVTKLIANGVTSQSYEGLLSSIPNVKEIDITVGDAEEGDISQIQTALRRHLKEQELTLIRLDLLPSEESGSGETMRGLGLHTTDRDFDEPTLLGVVCGPTETVIDLVQSSTRVMSSSLYSKRVSESLNSNRKTIHNRSLTIMTIGECKLTAMITSSMWSCLRSFPSLGSLTISDSTLSFPPSPPELTSVTWLKAERMTSQSYENLLSSLPGLEVIDITMNDAERDISQIAAGLRRTGGQQLTRIDLQASKSLPQEKKTISRQTMRGLGLLIREQTKNLHWLGLDEVKCTDEDDLVDLIECCRHVKAMEYVRLYLCGTKAVGRLGSHLKSLHALGDTLMVWVYHDTGGEYYGHISHTH